jgi:DinB family protein
MSEAAKVLERYRRGAEVVAVSVTGAAGSQLAYQPAPGAWCVKQILGHLADAELIAAVRFRRILVEDNPPLLSYPQDAFAEKLGYRERKLSDLIQMFRNLRSDNHGLLKRQPSEAFDRVGTHNVDGIQTLHALVNGYNEHTEKHARQIQETRRLFKLQRDAGKLPGSV